jgi:hypothetical protein
MSTFALDVNSNAGDIITGLNYALANLGTINGTGNVLTANTTTGEITTTSSNSSGYTTTSIVSYLYQYMGVKYANSSTGGSGFTSNSRLANYYGLRNTSNVTISSNPVDYVWFQVTGGFGTTKALYYQTIGGRQIAFFAGNSAPSSSFIPVPDMPNANSTPINLDTITSAQNNQIVNVNAYYQANITPATPSGGTYNFQTFTLTAPAGWSANIPGFVSNTSIYISQAAFTGNSNSTAAPPATGWTTPAVYSSQFQGNTGATGARGFVPMGFVITASDPTIYSNAALTTAYSSSRTSSSPPIGLGFAPIQYDTAQFAYTSLFTGNTTTIVKQYDGSGWTSVVGNVISGGLFVPGSINANTLNANQIYALTIASTNANVGNVASAGFWLDNVSGDARFAGNTNIGANLIIGANAQIGANLTVGSNLTVGQSATIGANLTVLGLVTSGVLQSNTVSTTNMLQNAATNTITVQDTTTYPTIQYTNGANNNPSSSDFLWPDFTRGFATGGGAPITTVTNGSATGSKIVINYSAYIYSDRNTAYNCVELYKSGASSFYKTTFLGSGSVVENQTTYPPFIDDFLLVGTNGSQFYGNLGNIVSQIAPTTTQDLYDGFTYYGQNFGGPTWTAYGNNGQYNVKTTSSTFSGNIGYFYSSNPPYGSPNYGLPLFNIYGVCERPIQGRSNNINLLVGASGRIATQIGYSSFFNYGGFVNETSNTFNDLNYVDSSNITNLNTGTNVYYVAVGAAGTILYNTKTYDSTGNIASSNGWTQATSNTTATLNSVASNYNRSLSGNTAIITNGNAYVAVGNQGTIVYCNNAVGNGPWLQANSVPITNNLQGVRYANGVWVAVGDAGTIITSTDGSNWTGPYANPAATNNRNLYTVVPGYYNGRWVAGGQEIIISSDTTNPGGTWSNQYFAASSVNQTLTRLQYFGSGANVANVSLPPSNRQVTNQQVLGGTFTDYNYTAGQTITYYLVLGNMAGNAVITTNSPSITVTEYKR